MKLSAGFKVRLGDCEYQIFGGRYKDFDPEERRLIGVKMAAEINHPCDVSIPTVDFSVPDQKAMKEGIIKALSLMLKGNDLYVGCMGGVGRTGLFMACMLKVMDTYEGAVVEDPVKKTRRLYKPHAVETEQQIEYVNDFDVSEIVEFLNEQFAPKVEYVRVIQQRTVVMTPWEWAYNWITAHWNRSL